MTKLRFNRKMRSRMTLRADCDTDPLGNRRRRHFNCCSPVRDARLALVPGVASAPASIGSGGSNSRPTTNSRSSKRADADELSEARAHHREPRERTETSRKPCLNLLSGMGLSREPGSPVLGAGDVGTIQQSKLQRHRGCNFRGCVAASRRCFYDVIKQIQSKLAPTDSPILVRARQI